MYIYSKPGISPAEKPVPIVWHNLGAVLSPTHMDTHIVSPPSYGLANLKDIILPAQIEIT